MVSAPPPMPSRAFRTVWALGMLGIVLSLAVSAWFWREARWQDQIRFDDLTHRLTEDLDMHTEKIEAMLRELARVLSMEPEPSLVVWSEFMDQASPTWNFPGITSIGYATNHSTVRVLQAMEPWLREKETRDRKPFYQLEEPMSEPRQWSAWMLDVFREGVQPSVRFNRQEHSVSIVEKSFHRLRFQELQGMPTFEAGCPFVMAESPGRSSGIAYHDVKANRFQDAAARDDVQIGQDLFPMQRTNGVRLSLATILVPVAHPRRRQYWERFAPDTQHADEQHWLRWQLNAGLIFASLDFSAILTQIQGKAAPEVEVEIHSEEMPAADNWLNPRPGEAVRAGSLDHSVAFGRLHSWPMYGNKWSLFLSTTPVFDQNSTRLRSWWAGGLGLTVTGLFCWALAVQTRGRLLEAQRASELKEARDALQGAHMERERLSHDLHDGAIQSLYAIQLGLTRAGRAVEARAPDTAHTLQESRASLDAVIGELRGFITKMKLDEPRRPAAGLAAVLDSLVRRLRPASAAPIELECDVTASARLNSAQALQLAAVAREALSNSLRHARAQNIAVRLICVGSRAVLEIIDDGVGFNSVQPASAGMGLNTMKRRALDLGASLEVQTAPDLGTRIRVEVPLGMK